MENGKKTLAQLFAKRDADYADDFRDRVVAQLNALAAEAIEESVVPVLVEVLTRKLAAIAYHSGPQATGDILGKFGDFLSAYASRAGQPKDMQ